MSLSQILMTILNVTESQLGTINAMPYIGIICGSVVGGVLLHKNEGREKIFVLVSLTSNAVAVAAFTASVYFRIVWCSYLSKFLIGLTQSLFVLYVPLWTNRHAPSTRVALWMGLVQGGVVAGTCLGYVVAGLLTATPFRWGVEATLLAQLGFLLLVILAVLIGVPGRLTSLKEPDEHMTAIPEDASISMDSVHGSQLAAIEPPRSPTFNSSMNFASSMSTLHLPPPTQFKWHTPRAAWRVFL